MANRHGGPASPIQVFCEVQGLGFFNKLSHRGVVCVFSGVRTATEVGQKTTLAAAECGLEKELHALIMDRKRYDPGTSLAACLLCSDAYHKAVSTLLT